MRSGVCGQSGSGGNALSTCALAIPTRSAPSSRARAFTLWAVIMAPLRNGDAVCRRIPLQRGWLRRARVLPGPGSAPARVEKAIADDSQDNTLLGNLLAVL